MVMDVLSLQNSLLLCGRGRLLAQQTRFLPRLELRARRRGRPTDRGSTDRTKLRGTTAAAEEANSPPSNFAAAIAAQHGQKFAENKRKYKKKLASVGCCFSGPIYLLYLSVRWLSSLEEKWMQLTKPALGTLSDCTKRARPY